MKRPLDQVQIFPSPSRVFDFWRSHRRPMALLLVLIAGVVFGSVWEARRRAEREFEAARAEAEDRSFVPHEKDARRAVTSGQVRLIQSGRSVRGLARYDGLVFAPTDGGLVAFDEDGGIKRRFTTLDGLPECDLTSIAVFRSKLFVGSRSQGLIVFDGKKFERYRWTDRNAQAVTALVEDRGRLLVGTFAGGLLEFDGARFKELKVRIDSESRGGQQRREGQDRVRGVNCLLVDGARLFVGTFADGLWVGDAATGGGGRGWARFTIADGLPSNRIVGVVVNGDRLLVASDFGVAVAQADQLYKDPGPSSRRFETVAILPELSGAIKYGASALFCKDSGELYRLTPWERAGSGKSPSTDSTRARLVPAPWKRPESLSSCQLAAFVKDNQPMGETLWLMSSEGIWRLGWQDERLSGSPRSSRFGDFQNQAPLSSGVVSALAFDDLGRLWVGSFRNGIDVIAPAEAGAGDSPREFAGALNGRRVAHMESEAVREINALVWDERSKRMLAATAHGLIRFDDSFGSQRTGAADGLLSDSVAHVALLQPDPGFDSKFDPGPGHSGLALATGRGLSLTVPSQPRITQRRELQFRGLTTVQGLPANGVYSVLSRREFIYAGTAGGLAQIAGGRVVRVFKDSNSKLTQNWVTALCVTGQRMFVGTYGGGVFELTPAGEFVSFASEIGKPTVNPNAMASDGERLYVGTLDGVWSLDLREQKWKRLAEELPSTVALSVAFDEKHVYFGTTGGIASVDKDYFKRVGE
jgi:ligand-binding sensor domain-containing protein